MELENECARKVAAEGYQVLQNPTRQQVAEARSNTGDTGNTDKNPDFLIEGHVFDCYAPNPTKAVRGVWTEVSRKVGKGQTQRVAINLEDWEGDVAALRKQFDDWPVPRLKELIVVPRSGAIIQIVKQD